MDTTIGFYFKHRYKIRQIKVLENKNIDLEVFFFTYTLKNIVTKYAYHYYTMKNKKELFQKNFIKIIMFYVKITSMNDNKINWFHFQLCKQSEITLKKFSGLLKNPTMYVHFSKLNLIFDMFVCLMVFNDTFNHISVTCISWWSVLLVEETGGPGENHRPVASNIR